MAAPTLQFNICESGNNQSLIFTETTGAYTASNTSGWGLPTNTDITTAQTATLTVTTPDGVTTIINLFTSSYPTTNDDLEYTITPLAVGYSATTGTQFPDGLYTFVYTVARTSATAFSYTQTKRVLIFGQAKCAVHSLYGDIPSDECDCSTDAIELAAKGMVFLKALELAAETGNSSEFDRLLEVIDAITINNDCNNCN